MADVWEKDLISLSRRMALPTDMDGVTEVYTAVQELMTKAVEMGADPSTISCRTHPVRKDDAWGVEAFVHGRRKS